MSKALSMGLRDRVWVRSFREAAARFGVSAASAIRWRQRQKARGGARPGPLGGDRRSQPMGGHAEMILSLLEAQPDATLAESSTRLWPSGAWRPVPRGCGASSSVAGSRPKKSGRADEQSCPDILKRRQAWFEGQVDLDPERLGVHRRNRSVHQNGPTAWTRPTRRTPAHGACRTVTGKPPPSSGPCA